MSGMVFEDGNRAQEDRAEERRRSSDRYGLELMAAVAGACARASVQNEEDVERRIVSFRWPARSSGAVESKTNRCLTDAFNGHITATPGNPGVHGMPNLASTAEQPFLRDAARLEVFDGFCLPVTSARQHVSPQFSNNTHPTCCSLVFRGADTTWSSERGID